MSTPPAMRFVAAVCLVACSEVVVSFALVARRANAFVAAFGVLQRAGEINLSVAGPRAGACAAVTPQATTRKRRWGRTHRRPCR
jgi:hypothetical protein